MRRLKIFVVAALALSAAPALAALTAEQADCPAAEAPAGLGKLLIDDIAAFQKSKTKDPRVEQGIDQTFATCAEKTKVSAEGHGKYRLYTALRIGRDEILVRFAALGIKPEIIDRALNLGPGKTNRDISQISDQELTDLTYTLMASGASRKALDDGGATLVGYYITLTSGLYQLLG